MICADLEHAGDGSKIDGLAGGTVVRDAQLELLKKLNGRPRPFRVVHPSAVAVALNTESLLA